MVKHGWGGGGSGGSKENEWRMLGERMCHSSPGSTHFLSRPSVFVNDLGKMEHEGPCLCNQINREERVVFVELHLQKEWRSLTISEKAPEVGLFSRMFYYKKRFTFYLFYFHILNFAQLLTQSYNHSCNIATFFFKSLLLYYCYCQNPR